MKWVIDERDSGKTEKAIKYSAKTGAIIVCNSMEEIKRIQMQSLVLKYNIPPPTTHSRLYNFPAFVLEGKQQYILDNVNTFLDTAYRGRIILATLSPEYLNKPSFNVPF